MPSPLSRLKVRSPKLSLALLLGFLFLSIAGSLVVYLRRQPVVKKINYTDLRAISETNTAASLNIDGELMTVTGREGSVSQAIVTNEQAQQEILGLFAKANVPVEFRSLRPSGFSSAISILFPVLVFVGFGFVGWRV